MARTPGLPLVSETMMELMKPRGRFYGTQGSFASYNPQLGGQTTCHTLKFADTLVVFDTGSGIIGLGNELIKDHLTPGITWREVDDFMGKFLKTQNAHPEDLGKAMLGAGLISPKKPLKIYVIFSHVHGDHLYGIQSFKPIYSPNTEIEFFGGMHDGFTIERVMEERVFAWPTYPVKHAWLASKRKYTTVKENTTFHLPCTIGGDIQVEVLPMYHPNQAYGYRFTWGGKVIVVTLDHEHGHEFDKNIVKLWDEADVVVTEVQYDEKMYETRKGFGHITAEAAAEHASLAKPKLIITTHHDPDASFEAVVNIARTIEEKSGVRTKFAMQDMPF